jgi:hypothetical protein
MRNVTKLQTVCCDRDKPVGVRHARVAARAQVEKFPRVAGRPKILKHRQIFLGNSTCALKPKKNAGDFRLLPERSMRIDRIIRIIDCAQLTRPGKRSGPENLWDFLVSTQLTTRNFR